MNKTIVRRAIGIGIAIFIWITLLILCMLLGLFLGEIFQVSAWNMPWMQLENTDPRFVLSYYGIYLPVSALFGTEEFVWTLIPLAELLLAWSIVDVYLTIRAKTSRHNNHNI